jgi:hypothetical protein
MQHKTKELIIGILTLVTMVAWFVGGILMYQSFMS